ncbi:unnamed protein product [Protopolystoma xenopodis]|uniref:Uncharacterized protein n=1 Tax=Protopolystoma xenopodis TaxID=117903 RepID=A0A3S5CTI4_9PLAT|nr:unnamed protein product [Protopolystoma xenopodis]
MFHSPMLQLKGKITKLMNIKNNYLYKFSIFMIHRQPVDVSVICVVPDKLLTQLQSKRMSCLLEVAQRMSMAASTTTYTATD